jgi:hypothetical protein
MQLCLPDPTDFIFSPFAFILGIVVSNPMLPFDILSAGKD